MIKRQLLPLLLLLFAPLMACAQADGESYQAGTDYDVITPALRPAEDGKIEVMEFFWYGCSHCYTFEPLISKWKETLGDDVHFRPSPAVWNKPMELHAKAYYAAEVLDVVDPMHMVLFQAMNVDRKRLGSATEIKALFTANGVSGDDFDRAFNSFGVSSQARQAASRLRAAKSTGTPEIVVAGKYRVSTRKARGQANMLKIASYLIDKERAAATAQ